MKKLLEKFAKFLTFIESVVDSIIIKFALNWVISDEELLKNKFAKFMQLLKPDKIDEDIEFYMRMYEVKEEHHEKIKNY